MVKRFLRKNKVEDDLAHITFVAKIRTLYFWNRNRQIDQENRENASNATPHSIFLKGMLNQPKEILLPTLSLSYTLF